jgi:uncharacterized protein YggE
MDNSVGAFLHQKFVRYGILAVLGFLALFLLLQAANEFKMFYNDTTYGNTITVSGTGEAVVIPDIANISFSVTESAATVVEAQKMATEKMDTALAAVKNLGVEEKDVKTSYYNVYPKYETQAPCFNYPCPTYEQKITGYEVTQGVEVKVRKTEAAGEVLAALGNTGVQNISGPNFGVDDPEAAKAEARKEAIKLAKEKARTLARELGVRLGKVVSFSDGDYGYPYPMYDSMSVKAEGMGGDMEMMRAPSLPVGEQEASVTVSVTFEIH